MTRDPDVTGHHTAPVASTAQFQVVEKGAKLRRPTTASPQLSTFYGELNRSLQRMRQKPPPVS